MCALNQKFTRQSLSKSIAQQKNTDYSPQMDRLSRADLVVSKKKRSTLHCCGEIPSAKPFEAHVARWCAEFHHFLRVGHCAGRCVYCAEGSKQLRGRARAQLRGNVAQKSTINLCIKALWKDVLKFCTTIQLFK